MSKLPKNYQTYLEEFKKLSTFINAKIADSSFYSLPFRERFFYIHRIKRLYSKLIGPVSDNKLKYILAAASLLIFATGCPQQAADTEESSDEEVSESGEIAFEVYQGFPFGILSGYTSYVYGLISPVLVDIDNDGDLDLYAAGYIEASNYTYSLRSTGRNTGRETSGSFYNSGVTFFENTGSADSPVFGPPQTAFYSGSDQTMADFIDIDGDGDLDMVIGGYYYYEGYPGLFVLNNYGTSPLFTGEGEDKTFEWIGFPASYYSSMIAKPEFADIDNDGDFDLFLGGYFALADDPSVPTNTLEHEGLVYLENTSNSASEFTFEDPVINPFDIADPGDFWFPTLEDLDQDGDLDLFLGHYDATPSTGGIKYYENIGDADNPDFTAPVIDPFGLDTLLDLEYIEYLLPAFGDMDNDGDLDLFPGGYFYFYNDDGTYYFDGGPVYLENTYN